MTNEEAAKMLTAKVECMKRETSGIDSDCNDRHCDNCDLCYAQGTMGEQKEALRMAIDALQTQFKQTEILAHALDGSPLLYPCSKLYSPEGWCREHCKSQEPAAECWLKYVEVMAKEQELNNSNQEVKNSNLQPTCNNLATDTISRQAAIDALRNINAIVSPISDDVLLIDKAEAMTELMMLPSAQAEQSNASEFWRKRADFYSDMCMNLICEMGKGVKIESVKISENGIEFIKEQPPAQPERKKGKWVQDNIASNVFRCSECGCDAPVDPTAGCEIKSNFCPKCGADMRGEQE